MTFPVKYSLIIKALAAIVGLIVVVSFLFIPILDSVTLGQLFNPIGGVWNESRLAVYPTYQEIKNTGYSGTVYRDNYGIPHIFAATNEDMAYILGYCQAQDRLFSMDMQRYLIGGRLSELMGDGENDANINTDKYFRVLGFARLGNEWWERILEDSPIDYETNEIRKALLAYCAGINRYISEITLSSSLPFEYLYVGIQPTQWHPRDCLMYGKYLAFYLSFKQEEIFMTQLRDAFDNQTVHELIPSTPFPFEEVVIPDFTQPSDYNDGNPIYTSDADNGPSSIERGLQAWAKILMNPSQWTGSNNWVVNGSLTESGKPILCGDPHLQLILPAVWWEVHVVNTTSGDSFYGVSFPGPGPMIEIGQTQHTAWSATVNFLDGTDYYLEDFSSDGSQYTFNSSYAPELRDVETVIEEIKVKGEPTVMFPVRFTRHNNSVNGTEVDDYRCPILTDVRTQFGIPQTYENVSVKWTGFSDDLGMIKGFFRLGASKNYTDFRNAMEVMSLSGQNYIFADSNGNIALFPRSFYPIRNATGTLKEGRYFMNGSSGEDEWTGYIPFDWMPNKVNPDQCYLASANQRSVNSTEYTKYYTSVWFASGYRGRRINWLLQNASSTSWNITTEIMKGFQSDNYDVAAEVFVPELLNAFYTIYSSGILPGPDLLNQTIEKLEAWNNSQVKYQMLRNEIGPTIFDDWLNRYLNQTFFDEFSSQNLGQYPQIIFLENITRFNKTSHWFNDTALAGTQNATEIMLRALNLTIAHLNNSLGSNVDDWDWGAVHKMTIQYLEGMVEPFDYEQYGCDGSSRTLNVAPGPNVKHGPSMRMIIDFEALDSGNLYSGFLSLPGGQSGNPISPHYDDNFQLWKNYQYHPILFPRTESQMIPFAKYTAIFL